ncbi:MAG TPA: hypothetical protein VGX51_06310 [Solirubrobacteraceae bacterium]|jgi:hypothetical protein|nr:hypothetical protein [Solirubrobacteraceae bacterium]
MFSATKSLPPLASCALASLALTACGGSGSNANASAQDSEQQIVNFARCMREHGVGVSTPTGSGGPIRVKGTNPQAMEAAQKACQRYQPKGGKENLSPAERAEREDQLNKFARCMREHGVPVQTQTPGSGGGLGIRLKDVNPESPAFQTAQKACAGFMPKLRRARGAGGPKPGQGGGPTTESSGAASGPPAGATLNLQTGK